MTDPIVEALLREREHYQRRNLPDRAAEVTAQLARLGYETTAAEPAEPPASAIPETTAHEAPPEQAIPPRPRPRKRDIHAP